MYEHDLYPPIKAFLEAQGYEVKAEVDRCDVVAMRHQEPPVIVELKTAFSLALVFQGIARQGLSDNVYLAVPPFSSRGARLRDALALCRRLGLGLLTVRLEPAPFVEALLDPAPYRPRQRMQAIGRLLREFQQRVGDPNQGGVNRRKIVTVYRQDALRCAHASQPPWPERRPQPSPNLLVSAGPEPSCTRITMVGSNVPLTRRAESIR